MTTVTVLAVGGTGESWPDDPRTDLTGLLAEVGAHLDHRFRCRWVGYPSSYGPVPQRDGMSFAESVAVGSARLQAAMAAVDGPVMLIGYSQGCVVIRDALSRARRSRRDLSTVLGVGLVADPHQPPGAVAGCEGFGIAGPGPALPPDIATMWIADPNDMICNASDDSLIRDIADLTSALSLRDVAAWMRRIGQTLRTNAFQNAARTAIRPRQWRRDITRIRTALVEIAAYLPAVIMWHGITIINRRGGRHVAYGSEPLGGRGDLCGCEVLAQWMQVQATFSADRQLPRSA
ncbi:hypothetical protein ASG12_11205 [Williamsia sp. Leaf354]|uniref:PE-PPE domain-containing protein n=1 Tax=Williamsia sp. Leaf354 TaxID=1736349 RepID=UPI0006F2349E|nr:PE-PPE domain-containing protein [Williamsia sp. Leaf354]KQR98900.1 hypothetical protein ASG12_11205 [Williamsia sp. Leaf354]